MRLTLSTPDEIRLETLDQSARFTKHNISDSNQIFINGRKQVSLQHFYISK